MSPGINGKGKTMKRSKLAALITTVLCMLCLVGLAACGGNTVAQKSDEELIKEDIATTIGTNVTKEEIAKGMREDAELQQLEQLGLDIDSYAENIAGKFEVNTESVKVDGDTAVATLDVLVPDFGEKADALADQAINKAIAGMDTSSMSEEELMKVFSQALNDALSSPDFPTTSTTLNVDYVKKDGSWQLKDPDSVKQQLFGLANVS